MPKKIAVIGLGNTLRQDDGVGILILELLISSFKQHGIEYLNFGSASFDLIHRMQNYDTVVLLDAINAGLAPGELKIFELKDVAFHLKGSALSTHELDLKAIFELYNNFKLKTKVYIAGVQVKEISFREGLSSEIEKNLRNITVQINNFLKTILS